MDLTPNNTPTSLDNDTQTPTPTQPTNTPNSNSSSFTNGSLNRHHPTTTTPPPPQPPSMVVSYKECLKNHAASIGAHALDGCGEFMPSSSSIPSQPRSLTCAACGCHRNFHRRDTQEHYSNPNFLSFYHSAPPPSAAAPPLLHRGLSLSTSPSLSPSPSPSPSPISNPSSPPPLSHHFPPSFHHHTRAPHVLLALGNACSDDQLQQHRSFFFNSSVAKTENYNNLSGRKKRYRTKFSQEQKEKMRGFSEKLGWRMHKGNEGLVQEFCNDIGVPREVFKVWMHNNKNSFRKRSLEVLGNVPSDEKINGNHNANGGGGGFHSDINNSLQHKQQQH